MLATIFWDGDGDGNSWNDPLNWDGDEVPAAGDSAIIDLGGEYTVTLQTNVTINELEFGGAGGQQTLSVGANTLLLNVGGTVGANGVVTLRGGSVLGTGSLTIEGSLEARNSSTVSTLVASLGSKIQVLGDKNIGSAILTVNNGFDNQGLIELSSIGAASSEYAQLKVTGGTLTNAPGGTIRTLAGAGGNRYLEGSIVNQGLIDAQTDTQITNDDATFDSSDGALQVALDQTLTIKNGTSVFGAGTALEGAGVVDLTGPHTLNLAGDLTLPGTGSQMALGGNVTVNGPGTLTNRQGLLELRSETVQTELVNEGFLRAKLSNTIDTLTTSPGSTVQILGDKRNGSGGGGTLIITSGFTNRGTIELGSVNSGSSHDFALLRVTGGTLTNAPGGTIRTLAGQGGTRILESAIENRGLIDAQTDTRITNDNATFTSSDGVLKVSFDQTLTIQGGTSIFGFGTALMGEGVVDLGGTHTLNLAGDLTLPGTGSQLALGGNVTVNGPGTLTNRQGLLELRSETVQTELVNEGFLRAKLASTIDTLTTSPGSTVQILGDKRNGSGGGGTLIITSGFTNRGTIELSSVNSGSSHDFALLRVTGGTLTNAPGGTIRTLTGQGGSRILESAIENRGFVQVLAASSFRIPVGDTLLNEPSGVIDVGADISVTGIPGGPRLLLNNQGTLRKAAGTGIDRVTADILNSGTVEVQSGTLRLSGMVQNFVPAGGVIGNTLDGGRWVVSTAQSAAPSAMLQVDDIAAIDNLKNATLILDGPGSFVRDETLTDLLAVRRIDSDSRLELVNGQNHVQLIFSNDGVLVVGPDSLLTLQEYNQSPEARMIIGLGGAPETGSFGKVEITSTAFSGDANLDGTLELAFMNGFGPFAGQSWEVMTFDQRKGDFTIIEVPQIGHTTSLEAIRSSTNVVVNSLVTATDLAIDGGNIILPPEAIAGEELLIEYTVDNVSETSAGGQWIDSLYLSEDFELDSEDRLLARVTHAGDVAGLDSYTESVTTTLPAARETHYHVILVVDSRGLVPDTNRTNNRAHSTGVVSARVSRLEIGSTVTRSIEYNQGAYYRVNVLAGRDVRITANMDRTLQAEFYARFGELPDRSNYDVSATDPTDLVHQMLLVGRSGPWYLMVHGRERARADRMFDLTAEELGFELSSFNPVAGGNVGPVTVTLSGSRFTPDTVTSLVATDGTEYSPTQQLFYSTNKLVATFDLAGLASDQYALRVDKGAESSTAAATFEVFVGDGPGQLKFMVNSPYGVLRDRTGMVHVGYRNVGDSEVAIFPISLTASTGAGFGEDIKRPIDSRNLDSRVASSTPLVVPPGGSGHFPDAMFGNDLSPGSKIEFHATTPFINTDEAHDWLAVKDRTRPGLVPTDAWDAIFANFTTNIGPTLGGLKIAIADAARYLDHIADDTSDINALLGFLFQQYDNALPNLPLDVTTDAAVPAPGLPLVFTRQYRQPISSRYQLGAFGRGWTHNYDLQLWTEVDGTLQPGYQGLDSGRLVLVMPDGVRVFNRQNEKGLSGGMSTFWTEVGGVGRILPGGVLEEPSGIVIRFDGPGGRLSSVRDTNLNQITIGYTDDRLTSIEHSNGDGFTLDYANGRVTGLTDHAGRVTTYAYDAAGEHLELVSSHYGTLSYSYVTGQGAGREHAMAFATSHAGTSVFFSYDDQGRLVRIERDGGVQPLTLSYDQGQVTFTDATGATARMLYNSRGQIGRMIDPFNNITQITYDENHSPIRTLLPGNTAMDVNYDTSGQPYRIIDSLGQTTVTRIEGTEVVAATFCNPSGDDCATIDDFPTGKNKRLLRLDDQLGRQTDFDYDPTYGNLTRITYPDATFEVFDAHDTQGNPGQYTNRREQPIELTWNDRGQLIRKDHADGSFEYYGYDDRGNLREATDGKGRTQFDYNDADQLIRVDYPNGRFLQYDYNAGGQPVRLSDQDGNATNYSYDAAGRLKRLTDTDDNLVVEYAYDAAGRLEQETRGNGTFSTYEYDDASRVEHLVHYAPDSSENSRFDYTYDDLGRRTSMTTLDGQWSYEYDSTGQLTRAEFASTHPDIPDQVIRYDYDPAGNRLRTIRNGEITPYVVNTRNQYVSVGSAIYSYDDDGNLISTVDGTETTLYTWDDESRLIGVTESNGDTWVYEYDVLGNRVATVHNGVRTEYLVDPTGLSDVVAEYAAGGSVIATFAHGIGLESRIAAGGAPAWYDFDATGSTVGLSDAGGMYVNQYRYLPYGDFVVAPTETVENPFGFVGQFGVMTEDNSLNFMRARYYSAADGRFISEDPIGQAGGSNLYHYALNDPVNYVDPSGLILLGSFIRFGTGKFGGRVATEQVSIRTRNLIARGLTTPAQQRAHIQGLQNNPAYRVRLTEAGRNFMGAATLAAALFGASPADAAPESIAVPIAETVLDVIDLVGFGVTLGSLAVAYFPQLGSFAGDLLCDLTHCEGGDELDSSTTLVVGSFDPNDIIGPAGFGDDGFLRDEFPLPYTIRFENLAAATAPAQEVVVTQQLDSDLDWTTFELGRFGFGEIQVNVPPGRNFYHTRVDAVSTVGVLVDFTAELNLDTGLATWRLIALDAETMDLPIEPLAGFLPPNKTSPDGEGFVSYVIRPLAGLHTGTRLDAQATIVFDTNAPIDTPAIYNTMDAGPPTSSVDALPAFVNRPNFTVSWSGADDIGGSGIAGYDVYVSDNGASWQRWLDDTTDVSQTFHGENHHTYGFYSVAVDNVDRRQATPNGAQVVTTVTTGWQNPANALDVNADGGVHPVDALVLINYINANGSGLLPVPSAPPPYFDPSGDGAITPLDVLLVVNFLNQSGGGEDDSESQNRPAGHRGQTFFDSDSRAHEPGIGSPSSMVNAAANVSRSGGIGPRRDPRLKDRARHAVRDRLFAAQGVDSSWKLKEERSAATAGRGSEAIVDKWTAALLETMDDLDCQGFNLPPPG